VLGGLLREFHEEMVADWDPEPRLIGLLKDDDALVGQVHLGVVFEADAAGRALTIRETDKLSGRFATLEEILPAYDQMETWSRFLFDFASEHQAGPFATS
jgi:predicted NUDIX family phosphoesterase